VPFLDAAQAEHSSKSAVARLKEHLHRYPKQHACMWIELIQGEGGFYAGTREFFGPILDLLRENNVAIWFDEIQTFARTTRPFAFQHFGLDAYVDLLTVGKITQVCATLFTDAYVPKPGLVSQTFTGSTGAITAAQAILDQLKTGDFFGSDGRVMRVRKRFMSHIERVAAAHPDWLKGPYGEGAMIAFQAFDGSDATAKKLLTDLFDAGVVSFVCGGNPARLRFLPPVAVVTDDQVDQCCRILEDVLAKHAAGAK
jgi:acetylornithine aminotransferase